LLVVSYDIGDDRRRLAVAAELKNFGVRVQRSVFECHLDPEQVAQLRSRLATLIDLATDQIRYYHLCPKDIQRAMITGTASLVKDWDYLVI
jgi:CRISPR-associated protein Cas2